MEVSSADCRSTTSLKPATETSETDNETAKAKVVQLVRDMVEATNIRNFQAEQYPWTELSPDFTAEQIFAHWPAKLDIQGFLDHFKTLTDDLPDYHAHAAEISATVNDKTGRATVFTSMENTGFTPGVIRYAVGRIDLVGLGNGVWRASRYRSMPGSPAASGGGDYGIPGF